MDNHMKLKKATYHLWTFTVSKLISSFGAQVYAFAISFYILKITGSATSFAANLLCSLLPRTLLAPFAGYFTDNYSRKFIAITSQIITTISVGILLLISISSELTLADIYITTSILSITATFSAVTFTSSISRLVDQKRIQKAMSLNQMSISFAAIGSPAVGGLLYGSVSLSNFLVIYMAASILACVLDSTMEFNLFSNRIKGEKGKKESIINSMRAGIHYLKGKKILITIMGISLFVNFLIGAYEVGFSYILIERLKIGSVHFGFTEGAFAVGMLLMSIYFSLRKEVRSPLILSKRGIIAMGFILAAITFPLILTLSYNLTFTYYIILMLSFGSVVIIVNTPIQVMLQRQIHDDYKGRVFSLLETMAMALMPLGMVIYGFLYDVFPAQWILLISSTILIIGILVIARPSVIQKSSAEMDKNDELESSLEIVG